ncbi:LysR family transcriptional regulator [Lysobacter enzymogenes]|uniref:LysR family transcriptional regulator n=1 Tax=Lysobacter enzymogenes TaxID=69 RepID=UPI00099C9034|nr:LysR family transcriptional regulator [Lysobacter enzymogenes]UZW60168.1 LysR family transcriptional regulator [Lysobacter enzymogenes]
MHPMHERNGSELQQIEAFAAVAEHGGFAAAARALGRDASVVSRRIDALEARLGVRLLARTTRRVASTEVGATYLQRVQAILGELSAADIEAREAAAAPQGLLRLALPAAFAQRWIAPWLPRFLAAYPKLRLELSHSDRFIDLVADGFDAAVRIGELADSRLVARRLAGFETMLCAAPSYLARAGHPQRPDELQRHACLGMPKARFWPEWKLIKGKQRSVQRIDAAIVSDDGEGLLAACIEGAGLLPAPQWLVGRELAQGQLVRVLPQWRMDYDGAIHVVLPPGRLVPAKTRAFVDWLAREFEPQPPWLRAPRARGRREA